MERIVWGGGGVGEQSYLSVFYAVTTVREVA